MGFLPNDYQSASVSNYMKFKEGTNKFRALDDAIWGFEWWTDENGKRKPNRVRSMKEVPSEYRGGDFRAKQFIAFPVWNYAEKRVQILEITQISVMNHLEMYEGDPEWGDAKGFDITVTRKGDGLDTKYTVTPSPHKEFPEAFEEYKAMGINLEALYSGDDPFSSVQNASEEVQQDMDEILNEIVGDKNDN